MIRFRLGSLLICQRSVDQVYSRLSFKDYARKSFMRPKDPRNDQQLLRNFVREISSLKRLSHQHLVSMIGSYTDQKRVAYLMEPIGDCNLLTYLCRPLWFLDENMPAIRSCFGCLASAVAYLHRQRVRHRDLKPQNVIVRNHRVYITDFGTALDWSKRGRDTTSDPTTPFTAYYMAPEVAKRSASLRNSASDIWSLGVVFLEMVTVLRGSTTKELRSFLETHGTQQPYVWSNASVATNNWFKKLRSSCAGPESDNEPMMWIKDMLQASPNNRPLAGAFTSQIRSASAMGHFIGHCCTTDDEMEDYISPPSSSHSGLEDDLDLDEVPPEPDFDKKPFGSFMASSRQSSIEHWLDGNWNEDNFISDKASVSSDLEDDFLDLPYNIVEDDSTLSSAILHQTHLEAQPINIPSLKVLKVCEGCDIVQDDSDDETEPAVENQGGYEVVEDSSDSGATVRQVPLPNNVIPVCSDSELGIAKSIGTDSVRLSSERAKEIEYHLDALPDEPLIDDRQNLSSEQVEGQSEVLSKASTSKNGPVVLGQTPTSKKPSKSVNFAPLKAANVTNMTRPAALPASEYDSKQTSMREPLNAANLAKMIDSASAPTQNTDRNQQSQVRMSKLMAEEPQISPMMYMQEVWEAASTAPTSIISETTRKKIGSFGSLLAWQDKDLRLLEKYARLGKAAAVRELLRLGCNPGTKDKPRIQPLLNAVKRGSQGHNKCVAALLVAGANVNARERSGRTVLHYAIEQENFRGYTNLIRDLLEAGADPNNKDYSGDFPLLQILYGGYEPLEKHKRDALACSLQPMFATDVNVNHAGTGNMPLHLAVRRKDPWAVSMLLTSGAQVNRPNGSGSTPLELAASGWNTKMSPSQNKVLEFLLKSGANVNEQNELGRTVLHVAASHLCERAVELLLERRSDPAIEDNEGKCALYHAGCPSNNVRKNQEAHATVMDLLHDAMGFSPLPATEGVCGIVTAVSHSRLEDMGTFLRNGAKVNHNYGSTQKFPLLHIALRNQDVGMVQLLVDNGVLVDAEDELGQDAFQVCASLNETISTNSNIRYMRKHGKRGQPRPASS